MIFDEKRIMWYNGEEYKQNTHSELVIMRNRIKMIDMNASNISDVMLLERNRLSDEVAELTIALDEL